MQAVIHNLRTQNRDFGKKADKKLKVTGFFLSCAKTVQGF